MSLPTPQPVAVSGNSEKSWKTFKEDFNNFKIATELDKKPDAVQAATLKTLLGDECRHILRNLALTAEQDTSSEQIIRSLDSHFVRKTNILFERFQFYNVTQLKNETVSQYVDRLRQQSKDCEFINEEEMLRDKLILGCCDVETRTRLLRSKKPPTLQETFDSLLISETTTCQLKEMEGQTTELNFMKYNRNKKSKTAKYTAKFKECRACGGRHAPKQCPAYGKTCRKCEKKNHYASQCRSKEKAINQLAAEDDYTSEELFVLTENDHTSEELFVVTKNKDCKSEELFSLTKNKDFKIKKIEIPLTLSHNGEQRNIVCQIDTGATCNVLSEIDLKAINSKCEYETKHTYVTMYNDDKVKCLGEVKLKIMHNNRCYSEMFTVLQTTQKPIISCNLAMVMGLIQVSDKNVKSVHKVTNSHDLFDEFYDVFEGLGCLPGEYNIDVDPEVTPVKSAIRRVPVPILDAFKKKIEDLEQRGIIEKVSRPTDWISSYVTVKKPNKLRICIDPKPLNTAIKRPHYSSPTIEEILPKLTKARIFTVLDAKDGFHQVKLSEESSFLTTFGTPMGRYRYKRLPFGICSAMEEFQRRQHEIIEDLEGVAVIADDYLIFGCGDTDEEAIKDHDRHLRNFLQRSREVNLKLNRKKAKLRVEEVKYMGHIIGKDGLKPDMDKIQAITKMPAPTSKKEVQRLMGCVTYLSKFLPLMSDAAEPLRRLTDKDTHFEWLHHHEEAWTKLKDLITRAPLLKYYDVKEEATIQCDASEYGLGATLMQNGQPVYFASKALSTTERNYAQIEKECL